MNEIKQKVLSIKELNIDNIKTYEMEQIPNAVVEDDIYVIDEMYRDEISNFLETEIKIDYDILKDTNFNAIFNLVGQGTYFYLTDVYFDINIINKLLEYYNNNHTNPSLIKEIIYREINKLNNLDEKTKREFNKFLDKELNDLSIKSDTKSNDTVEYSVSNLELDDMFQGFLNEKNIDDYDNDAYSDFIDELETVQDTINTDIKDIMNSLNNDLFEIVQKGFENQQLDQLERYLFNGFIGLNNINTDLEHFEFDIYTNKEIDEGNLKDYVLIAVCNDFYPEKFYIHKNKFKDFKVYEIEKTFKDIEIKKEKEE